MVLDENSYLLNLKNNLTSEELLLLQQEVQRRGKDKLIAYLLWWFLGLFGAHRFYLGRTGSAVGMLILTITLIGMIATFIWWIVDAFLIPGMVTEYNTKLEYQILQQLRPRGQVQSSQNA